MPEYEDLVRRLTALERAFKEHQHTGLDSKPLQSPIQDQGSLTAKNDSTVDATYDAVEAGVIENNRTRIGEIEDALKNIGILS